MYKLQDIQRKGKLFANQYLLLEEKGKRGFVDLWKVKDNETNEIKILQIFDDQYILINPVGNGGYSEVWLALDSVSLINFAIKIYSKANLGEDGIAEFRKEFAVMCTLSNTNLLHPQTFNVCGKYPYLVLPYCGKGSANDLVGHMSEEHLWSFIRDVSYGLTYLHNCNPPIIHRDIKPLNILINDQNQYLISDFGISIHLRKTMSRTQNDVIGTLQYMGPECHPKEGNTNTPKPIIANDIWAFGATVYELATGNVPFGDYGGLTQRSLHKVPEIKKGYSQKLKNLIYLCLSENPWDRPSAEDIFDIARDMKQLPPSPAPWKKVVLTLVILVGLLTSAYIFSENGYIFSENGYIFSENGGNNNAQNNPNDSIMKEKVMAANNIVNGEWEKSNKYDNFASGFIKRISEAVQLHQEAMKLNVSHDSVRKKAESSWAKSQVLINESYKQLDSLEKYYRSIPVKSVADSFAKRRSELEQFIIKSHK